MDDGDLMNWPNIVDAPGKLSAVPDRGEMSLPNGCALYWTTDSSVGGRVYLSDEVGGGVHVWNTALVDNSTLLAAIVCEERLRRLEDAHARRAESTPDQSADDEPKS